MTARIPDWKRKRVLDSTNEDDVRPTQAQLSERHGISQKSVSRIEADAGQPRRKRRSFSDSATGLTGSSRKSAPK